MHNVILPPNPIEELERNKALAEHQQLTKKERRFLKRRQKEEERLRRSHQRKLKKFLLVAVGALIIGGGVLALILFLASRSPIPESEIISKQGIHRHIELSISILGEKQGISDNIGLGLVEKSIHTHGKDRIIHLEFSGLVKKDDIKLGSFFKVWGKTFDKDCIFDKCNGPEGQLKTFINGELNHEFENYIMQDKDKIEIIFE